MKIFDNQSIPESTVKKETKSNGKVNKDSAKTFGKKGKAKIEKENVSDAEIREKLAHNVELTNASKQKIIKPNTQKLGDGFMANTDVLDKKKADLHKINEAAQLVKKPEAAIEKVEEGEKVKSDVGQNNPNDPTTKEKLKDVLGKGAFSFNGRERDILEKILMQD